MYNKLISNIKPLGFTWETSDPFLFCVHHLDHYPEGNDQLGPSVSLAGRNLGQDFTTKNSWRMYHGEIVPGFPAHPHRGFETVTVVLNGFVDHSDSHGASGRYGRGDVQWMTAGAGLQHSEMFPLLNKDKPNPLELFQIWLNLPQKRKFSEPYYKMLWAEDIPDHVDTDKNGRSTKIAVIAGKIADKTAPPPAPESWAADPANELGIWLIHIEANAIWTIPSASPEISRTLYFYRGSEINIAGIDVKTYHSVELLAEQPVVIENGNTDAFLLLLQGRPINESVVQHGPFVMNSAEEIQQAFSDYRRTQFGGWPWERYDNVHDRSKGRFARYSDGREEVRRNKLPVVGLIMKSLEADFFREMQRGAVDYANRRGDLTLIPAGTGNQTEIQKQIQLVEDFIKQQVDAMIVVPIDSKALIPPVVKAVQAGIEVVNIDIMLNREMLDAYDIELLFVGPDNETAAKTVGDVLAKEIGKQGKVVILEGVPEAMNAQQRKRGFLRSIEEYGLNLLGSGVANWETDQASRVFSEMFKKHADLQGVMCANDAMAVGVIKVLENAGKSGKVKVVGFDNDASVGPLIKNGDLLATIDCFGSRMAVEGINYAMKALQGEKHKGWIKTGMKLITHP